FTLIAGLLSFGMSAQFVQLVVEEVNNNGAVPGRTYRIYAVVKNADDHIHAVFGEDGHPLKVESTQPFFQSEYGGGMSKEVNRASLADHKELNYDSWVTIGAEDNYSNALNVFIMTLDEFEAGKTLQTSDGAWFVTPDNSQAFAGEDKKILLLQLTTEGVVNGVINLQGRTAAGEIFKEYDLTFTCGK
ncbi:MAG: hypothetical protein KDC12_08665, partial [Flavobacteriales bacterium]|nr:hypothetical protein [Flavobacteriales bacterium]